MKDSNLVVYESDASGIKGKATEILFPTTKEEIQKIVRENARVTIRGAGTGLAGGCVPQNEVVLDLSKMNKILGFDEAKKIVEVEPGVVLDELNDYLDRYNLEFPVKPSSHSVCTIGGMIACNAAGERAVKYGKTGKWVEALEVVDGHGEIVSIHKFNLNDIIGLEGITGVIVKAGLKLVEKKKRTASLIVIGDLKDLVDRVENYSKNPEVSEIEFLDKHVSSLVELGSSYNLIIEFEDLQGELKEKEYEVLMKKRESVYPSLASLGFNRIEDPKIPLSRLAEFACLLEEMKIPYYGHLGMGIIHPVFRDNEQEKIKRVHDFVKRIKGKVSGEHGIGLVKKEFLDDNEKKLFSLVKKRYDPACKINCGKVVDMDSIKLNSNQERRLEELEKIEQAIEKQNQLGEYTSKENKDETE